MRRSRLFDAVLLAVIFLTCAGSALYVSAVAWKRVNTPEVVAQNKINDAIQNDLCYRVERDLAAFKETPLTFRRATLRAIEAESRAMLRPELNTKGVPIDMPIEYRHSSSKFSKCMQSIATWLQITSPDGSALPEEYAAAGIAPPTATSAPGQSSPPLSTPPRNVRRLALVIGNAAYESRPLANPTNDADDIAAALGRLGFETINVRNAPLQELRSAIASYLRQLHGSDVGLVFFSGHGVEYAGRNYILPVDFNANDEDEIPRQAIDLSSLVEMASRVEGKVNIFVLDACRSSFVVSRNRSATQGLRAMATVTGTLVAYSTSPGAIALDGSGRNSPYTRGLLRNLNRQGLRIEDVFKETARLVSAETGGRQNPWYSSSLKSDFSLN
jgi:hypothetical protein